jgi:sec-independent protein translocase protein TatB
MLDIGWTELMLIAVVAIVVIGPRELPDALRTLGRMLNKVRRMAGEFQGQFNQALREANLEDVKKDFDEIRQSASVLKGGLNPVGLAAREIAGAAAAASLPPTPAASPAPPVSTVDAALTSSAVPPAATGEAAPPAADPEPPHPTEPVPSAFATSPAFRR